MGCIVCGSDGWQWFCVTVLANTPYSSAGHGFITLPLIVVFCLLFVISPHARSCTACDLSLHWHTVHVNVHNILYFVNAPWPLPVCFSPKSISQKNRAQHIWHQHMTKDKTLGTISLRRVNMGLCHPNTSRTFINRPQYIYKYLNLPEVCLTYSSGHIWLNSIQIL